MTTHARAQGQVASPLRGTHSGTAAARAAGAARAAALEQECGITREMIDRIEKGKSKKPSFGTVVQLVHGLGLTLTKFPHLLEDGVLS
jgi:transcriptional regulator with XRE-family HTH domain